MAKKVYKKVSKKSAKSVAKKPDGNPIRVKSSPSDITDSRLDGSDAVLCIECSTESAASSWKNVDYDCNHCSALYDSGNHMAIECPGCGAENRWSYPCEKEFPFE